MAAWALGPGIQVWVLYWVIGQCMGGFWTGLATDPNAAPLVTLLDLAAFASIKSLAAQKTVT